MLDKPNRPPGEGAGSPADRRGALALSPPPLHPLHLLQHLPLQQQPLSLQKRVRNSGPGALLRDEQRRLEQIEPGILAHKIEVEGGPALPPPALPLAHRETVGDPALPHPGPRPSLRPIVLLASRKRKGPPALQTSRQKEVGAHAPLQPPRQKEAGAHAPLQPPRQKESGAHAPLQPPRQKEAGAHAPLQPSRQKEAGTHVHSPMWKVS